MAEKHPDYLEQQLECTITKENNEWNFRFQQEKIKLDDQLEIAMLENIDPDIERKISMIEDELLILIKPKESYQTFEALHKKDRHSRWVFAHHLVERVRAHSYPRVHLIVAPDNMVLTKGLAPVFLHYGVKESLPPYEQDEERIWHEVRAVIAAAVDEKFSFEQYIKFHTTLQISPLVKEIFDTETTEQLTALISRKIEKLEERERAQVHIPQKKWKTFRYVGIGLLALLIPAIIYTAFSVFFLQPRAEAFIRSSEYYQKNNFSDVINELEKYKVEDMQSIVQYQLAHSYIVTGDFLLGDTKKKVRSDLTLQTDKRYFDYWIRMGRGESERALEIARELEDRFSIMAALISHRETLQADSKLDSEEKRQKVADLDKEYNDLKEALDEERAESEEVEEARQEALEQVQNAEQKEQEQAEAAKKQAEEAKKKAEEAKQKQQDKPAEPKAN
ncbi:type VII secretion protein EssB [Bacillus mangrovi]|uniref:Type VII secretion protein EssB n=1 Tax=Metabacillus mangrovi TaxID=1491830 RepID=A0A7X2S5M4_9BACI|nr:type VII secretion protein EssB [Metabacillus mangrovi]MTH53960.1 type VII secretion protein EssB [Metabacillus mangrovi]